MRRLDLHVPVLGTSEPTGPLDAQQLLFSASLSFVQDAASRSVSLPTFTSSLQHFARSADPLGLHPSL